MERPWPKASVFQIVAEPNLALIIDFITGAAIAIKILVFPALCVCVRLSSCCCCWGLIIEEFN